MSLQVPTVTLDDLRVFHAKHFPHAAEPENYLHGVEAEASEELYEEIDDGLGYYPDGIKRTLTDEQIAMFRHSEIRAILRMRRLQREERDEGEVSDKGHAAAEESSDVATPLPSGENSGTCDASMQSRQALANAADNPERVKSGRVEKPKTPQQWATSSARTKAKNKKNRDKYKAKKKGIRLQKELAKKTGRGYEEDDESDEWDPWHQANGPDAQKDDALDLDY